MAPGGGGSFVSPGRQPAPTLPNSCLDSALQRGDPKPLARPPVFDGMPELSHNSTLLRRRS